jgi:hypothetical protein
MMSPKIAAAAWESTWESSGFWAAVVIFRLDSTILAAHRYLRATKDHKACRSCAVAPKSSLTRGHLWFKINLAFLCLCL